MALDKQIYLYGLDTSCFYTDKEFEIHKRLLKLYNIKKRLKDKIKKIRKNKIKKTSKKSLKDDSKYGSEVYKSAIRRTVKLINKNKFRLNQEFENTRKTIEIRQLREDSLISKNIQSMFTSTLSRTFGIETNSITKDITIVQVYFFQVAEDLLKNGFMYQNEKYVLFTASAGQIRLKKFVVIKESVLNKKLLTLTCGLTRDKINRSGGVNTNKYLAYLALNNSATEPWIEFDIDKSIVVEDFETQIVEEVDYIDDVTYEITRKKMPITIPHTDGCGIMLSLGNRMIRLPWMKGLMTHFPYLEFLKENNHCGDVVDIYGNKHNIFDEDIQFIFTKSQFKMWKYYDNWDSYKFNFKKYHCEAGYCNLERENIPNTNISYQMLQTLTDVTEEELLKLCEPTISIIKEIGNDFRVIKRILGFDEYNYRKNYIQQALEIYPEMIRDNYSKEIIKAYKNKIVKNAKAGKLYVNGKYTFVSPDMYAFCQWLFLGESNPEGLLNKGEVSCRLFNTDKEVDCLRSPHLYIEHCVRTNILNEQHKKWFNTNAIYTSVRDPISKVLMHDNDGDTLLVVQDKTLCKIAKRNTEDVVPLYYEMKKASCQNLSNESLYEGLDKSFRSESIGLYSNSISKIYDSGKLTEEKKKAIKWLCMENNFSIDGAKTLYMPTRPDWVNAIIKKYTKGKLPHYFIYAKNKETMEVSKTNNSTVNRLEKIIPSSRLVYNKTIGKMDFKYLLFDKNFSWNDSYLNIINSFEQIYKNKKRECHNNYKTAIVNGKFQKSEFDLYLYHYVKENFLKQFFPMGNNLMLDILIYYYYKIKKSSNKQALWGVFGDILVERLKSNTTEMPSICPVCGQRVKKQNSNKYNSVKFCSQNCFDIFRTEYYRFIKQKNSTKRT